VPPADGYAFGPYRLDLRAKRLLRGDDRIDLHGRQFDLLAALVKHAGILLSKDELITAAWGDVAVSDNSLAQGVSHIRSALDDDPDRYVQTKRGRGYQFIASVQPIETSLVDADLDAMVAPHRVFMDGRAALESLGRDEILRARDAFARIVHHHPHDAGFHVGLANACLFSFEATRAGSTPDIDALRLAVKHAREACRLGPDEGEHWVTLGLALVRTGAREEGLATIRRGVSLDPENWRHLFRLAYVSWGEECLVAARRTQKRMPGSPMARWIAASVYIARLALAEAERELDAGLVAMAAASVAAAAAAAGAATGVATPGVSSRLSAVGLTWLKGLVLFARRAHDEALVLWRAELALEGSGHIYAREIAANTWSAIGAHHLLRGDPASARAAFGESLARVPHHPMSRAGLAILDDTPLEPLLSGPLAASFDEVMACAAVLVARGDVAGAVALVAKALAEAPAGNAGWRVPIEPLLRVQEHLDAWAPVLALLRQRAM
jgi:DNA-binding winged helix-turn-helix (wHTH) protein